MDTAIPDVKPFNALVELPGNRLRVVFGPDVAEHRLEKLLYVSKTWATVGKLADVLARPKSYGPLFVGPGAAYLMPSEIAVLLDWAKDIDLRAAADLVAQQPDERALRRAALPFEPDELAELDAVTRARTAFDDLLAMLEAQGNYYPTLWVDIGEDVRRLADAYDKAQAHRGDARRAFRGW